MDQSMLNLSAIIPIYNKAETLEEIINACGQPG